MDINVKKRDGSEEPWSYDKLVAAVTKAGIPLTAAENLASQVQEWVKTASQDGTILSTKVRDKLVELMKVDFPVESDNFQAYKKD